MKQTTKQLNKEYKKQLQNNNRKNKYQYREYYENDTYLPTDEIEIMEELEYRRIMKLGGMEKY